MENKNALSEFLKKACRGAVEIYEKEGQVFLSRFSEQQRKAYEFSEDFHTKTSATSGIVLEFETTAQSICIRGNITKGSSRNFYYFDTYVDGILYSHDGDTYENENFPYEVNINLIALDYGKKYGSPDRYKKISIYFPQLACASVTDIALDGISVAECAGKYRFADRPLIKAMFFGDSITQGYDAQHPSYTYPAILSRRFSLEFVNKGIGGDKHNADVLFADSFCPDMIFTAYGTNDWNGAPSSDYFADKIKGYFARLAEIYPTAPIFVITPVWRRDGDRVTNVGSFEDASNILADIAGSYNNVKLLRGLDFVARPEDHFSDKRLHPNDMGFFVYTDSLCSAILSDSSEICRKLKTKFAL